MTRFEAILKKISHPNGATLSPEWCDVITRMVRRYHPNGATNFFLNIDAAMVSAMVTALIIFDHF
jgi:hypothetical protein